MKYVILYLDVKSFHIGNITNLNLVDAILVSVEGRTLHRVRADCKGQLSG